MQFGVPVHQAFAAVDQAIFIEAYKGFLNPFVEALIHGEAFGFPVHRVAQSAHLLGNSATGLFLPLPDFFNKLIPAQRFPIRLALGGQFALHHHLGGNTGMVCAHLPESVLAFHAVVSGQGIHNAVLQSVTNMQAAGNIRRWNNNTVGVGTGFAIRCKIAALLPSFVPLGFNILGGKCFFHY